MQLGAYFALANQGLIPTSSDNSQSGECGDPGHNWSVTSQSPQGISLIRTGLVQLIDW